MLLEEIRQRWIDNDVPAQHPVIRFKGESISLEDIFQASRNVAFSIPSGSVVAHIGDFTPEDIHHLIHVWTSRAWSAVVIWRKTSSSRPRSTASSCTSQPLSLARFEMVKNSALPAWG